MAIHFASDTPKKLLATFKKAIDDGHVVTWAYDSDGDFTHTADQWKNEAWLSPRVTEGARLSFFILKPKNKNISKEVYGVYHGRFIETMLIHCDKLFKDGRSTAQPETGDIVS